MRDSPPVTPGTLWRTLDFLLRRRGYLLSFRRFRMQPRRPSDFPRLVPGMGMTTADQLVVLLVRARLLRRLEPEGAASRALHALTPAGTRLTGLLGVELRRLDIMCRKSVETTTDRRRIGKDAPDGFRCGAWVVRRLLRKRGAMTLLGLLPPDPLTGEDIVALVKAVPGANPAHCLKLLVHCGLIRQSRPLSRRVREYRLTELGMHTRHFLTRLDAFAAELSEDEAVLRKGRAIFAETVMCKTA